MVKRTWRKTPFIPLEMEKGVEARGVGGYRPCFMQPPEQAEQTCRVMDEQPFTDVETGCRTHRGLSPRLR
jgi:hypothetical protein